MFEIIYSFYNNVNYSMYIFLKFEIFVEIYKYCWNWKYTNSSLISNQLQMFWIDVYVTISHFHYNFCFSYCSL